MEKLTQLNTELSVLNVFVNQHIHDANKEHVSPGYLHMALPHYERELIAVTRISELIQRIYHDVQA